MSSRHEVGINTTLLSMPAIIFSSTLPTMPMVGLTSKSEPETTLLKPTATLMVTNRVDRPHLSSVFFTCTTSHHYNARWLLFFMNGGSSSAIRLLNLI